MWGTAVSVVNRKSATEEHVAQVRVKAAENACRNPYSHLKLKLTVDQVMNSEVVIAPLRFLHICPTSVSSCAVIVSGEEAAKKAAKKPVWVKDYVTVHGGLQPRMGEPSSWHEVDYYEAINLCPPGEAWKLIEGKVTWMEGEIPVDPSGGVVSTNAIGATGLHRIAEAALQCRGDAGEGQVNMKTVLALAYAQGADQFASMVLLSKTL
jgi:acetyl-CoA C-acetyltransferase